MSVLYKPKKYINYTIYLIIKILYNIMLKTYGHIHKIISNIFKYWMCFL